MENSLRHTDSKWYQNQPRLTWSDILAEPSVMCSSACPSPSAGSSAVSCNSLGEFSYTGNVMLSIFGFLQFYKDGFFNQIIKNWGEIIGRLLQIKI